MKRQVEGDRYRDEHIAAATSALTLTSQRIPAVAPHRVDRRHD